MSDTATPPANIVFRPGVAADWPRAAPLARAAGDGGPTIDRAVWDRWAAEADARLVLAARGEEIVALARLSELGPAEWWVEGIRIHPQHRDEGLGGALLAHLIELFGQIGIGLLRFAVSSRNTAMADMAGQHGFRRIISYRPMEGPSQLADYRSFKRLQPQNLDMAHQYLRRSPMNRVNRFAEKGWTFYYLTQERLHQYLSDPGVQVLGWRQFDQMSGLAIVHHAPDGPAAEAMEVGYIDAPDDTTFLAMLAALRGIAAKRSFPKIEWMMPLSIGLDRPVGTTDLQPHSDTELWLFERPLRL